MSFPQQIYYYEYKSDHFNVTINITETIYIYLPIITALLVIIIYCSYRLRRYNYNI